MEGREILRKSLAFKFFASFFHSFFLWVTRFPVGLWRQQPTTQNLRFLCFAQIAYITFFHFAIYWRIIWLWVPFLLTSAQIKCHSFLGANSRHGALTIGAGQTMNVGVAHSESNPNATWMSGEAFPVAHIWDVSAAPQSCVTWPNVW